MSDNQEADEQPELTQADAEQLIREMKTAAERLFFMPKPGEEHQGFNVIGDDTGREYRISVWCARKNPNRHQIAARTDGNIMLMRLCVLPAHPHTNPEDDIVRGSHWHFYQEGKGCHRAVPADIESPDFIRDTVLLLERFHVVRKPQLRYPAVQGELGI